MTITSSTSSCTTQTTAFCQYLSITYTERLSSAGIQAPVGTIGYSEGAAGEAVNRLSKKQLFWAQGPWTVLDAVEYATHKMAIAWPENAIVRQPIGRLPWGHVITLLEKLDDPTVRDWYAAATDTHGWSATPGTPIGAVGGLTPGSGR